jgi:hypothetical protein
MPTTNKKARLLLKAGKAKIIGYDPFTIQLLYTTGETRQPVSIGVDTGSKHVGIAVTSGEQVLAAGTVELRQDVTPLLTTRREYRHGRRNRKTRYRQPRFQNRTRSDKWLPPSIQSRVDNTIQWIRKFESLLPQPSIKIEVGKFDMQKILNPDTNGKEYQQGNTYSYRNDRYYIFARDGYTCQICHGKSNDKQLRTHHIIQRIYGGTNRVDNQTTVCETCHLSFHQGTIQHTFKKPSQYREPAFMNILRKRISSTLSCEITYGNRTVVDREYLGLEKTHYNDAIAVSGIIKIKTDIQDIFVIKQFRKKKRSLHESTPRKGRSAKNVSARRNNKNTPSQGGFYLNDKVNVLGRTGHISGFTKGGAYVKDIDGAYITLENKNYKQVPMRMLQFVSHNNNWQFYLNKTA